MFYVPHQGNRIILEVHGVQISGFECSLRSSVGTASKPANYKITNGLMFKVSLDKSSGMRIKWAK